MQITNRVNTRSDTEEWQQKEANEAVCTSRQQIKMRIIYWPNNRSAMATKGSPTRNFQRNNTMPIVPPYDPKTVR
ncbi:hypothetical protein Plhal703r1_c06g0036461 [Plasmopara halstedii]